MKYTIYLRTNKINGKQYVGQTKNFKTRERDWNCIKSRYGSHYLTNERNKYGTENFDVKILAEVESREEAWELEQKFIEKLNTKYPNGYNMSYGGEKPFGYKHSEKQKQKWSNDRKGKRNSILTEFKKGITPWLKGKHHTEKSNEKNRQAHLGKIYPTRRKPIIQLTLNFEYIKEFASCAEAAKELGFKSDESIRKACKEPWRTSGGFKWMYKEDYEKMLEKEFES